MRQCPFSFICIHSRGLDFAAFMCVVLILLLLYVYMDDLEVAA
jgi:hypothetical protein